MKKRGLGKGLDLIFAANAEDTAEGAVSIRVEEIEPNRDQPRKEFDSAALAELADSIAQHGVLQPLLLRPMLSGGYRIVAGERRYRAARMAGLSEVPAVVREMSDAEEMLFALIENLQREDLTPLEEARGYRTLIETQGFTQEEVSQAVGKSRPTVTNALRLLNLPEEALGMLERGEITAGHARALLSFKTEEELKAGMKRAREGASVRQLEAMTRKDPRAPKKAPRDAGSRYYREAQLALGTLLGRKVKISGTKKKGALQIEFYGEADLKDLMDTLHLGETPQKSE